MFIESNVGKVIEGLRAYRTALPAAIQRAIAPDRWKDDLLHEAHRTLLIEAGLENMWAIDGFLAMMGYGFLGKSSAWWMSAPNLASASATLETAREAVDAILKTGQEKDLFDQLSIQNAMNLIQQWVEAGARGDADGKRLTAEDQSLMQQQGQFSNLLVERLWYIFGIHPGTAGKFTTTAGQEMAAKSLTPHILKYFAENERETLGPKTVSIWLHRVLVVWTEYMKAHLPLAIAEELSKIKPQI